MGEGGDWPGPHPAGPATGWLSTLALPSAVKHLPVSVLRSRLFAWCSSLHPQVLVPGAAGSVLSCLEVQCPGLHPSVTSPQAFSSFLGRKNGRREFPPQYKLRALSDLKTVGRLLVGDYPDFIGGSFYGRRDLQGFPPHQSLTTCCLLYPFKLFQMDQDQIG